MKQRTVFIALAGMFLLLSFCGLAYSDEHKMPEYFVQPPPFTEGIFPCSQCHNASQPPNKNRRELSGMHSDIVFKGHAESSRWCLDCHDADNRDNLHLASGTLIPFTESYKLCGQCHGNVFRDWKIGIHGKRTGMWNGKKQYRLCVHCHNPHNPRFKQLAPLPPPEKPLKTRGVKTHIEFLDNVKVSIPKRRGTGPSH